MALAEFGSSFSNISCIQLLLSYKKSVLERKKENVIGYHKGFNERCRITSSGGLRRSGVRSVGTKVDLSHRIQLNAFFPSTLAGGGRKKLRGTNEENDCGRGFKWECFIRA